LLVLRYDLSDVGIIDDMLPLTFYRGAAIVLPPAAVGILLGRPVVGILCGIASLLASYALRESA
jgi:hypothetical protein